MNQMCGNSQCGQLFHGSVVHRRMRTNTLYGLEALRIRVRKSTFSGSDGQSKRPHMCQCPSVDMYTDTRIPVPLKDTGKVHKCVSSFTFSV